MNGSQVSLILMSFCKSLCKNGTNWNYGALVSTIIDPFISEFYDIKFHEFPIEHRDEGSNGQRGSFFTEPTV